MRNIKKIMVLMMVLQIMATMLPLLWLYCKFADFTGWMKQEWAMIDMTKEQKKELHNKLMSGQGCPDMSKAKDKNENKDN